MDGLTGRTLGGRYRVGRRLGEGGMGTVYEGEQMDLRRKVAIKVLKPEAASVQGLQRFQREARAAAALRNPHIVQVSDFQVNAGEPPFLVMELLEGFPLSDLISRDGRVSPERLVVYAHQVLSALFAAHDAGIIHRDIKPENVFVTQSAVGELVKLVDFGIAKLYGQPAEAVTRFGAIIGSVYYMSPEQAAGTETDPRSDLFSLGACMYHALSGCLPFEGSSAIAVLRALSLGERKPLRLVAPHVDPRLEAIVHKALAGDPAARFQSAREMDAALELLVSQASLPPGATGSRTAPAGAVTRLPPHVVPAAAAAPKRKRSSVLWTLLGLLGLVATGAGGIAFGARVYGSHANVTTITSSAPLAPTAISTEAALVVPLVSTAPAPSNTPSVPANKNGSNKTAQPHDAGRASADSDAGSAKPISCSDNTACKALGQFGRCTSGKCACEEGSNLCNGACVPASSPAGCGGCGIRCAAEETCKFDRSAKKLTCMSCADLSRRGGEAFSDYKYCGVPNICVDVKIRVDHCGACGYQCPAGTRCLLSKCQ
jgi:eukaryotic-like serine/threonine-protein kinase